MSNKIKSALRTGGPALIRFRARSGRPRNPIVGGAGTVHAQALVSGDRHVIEIMEVLADILACVFEDAQEASKIDLPSGGQVADSPTVQSKELLATR